MGRYDGVLICSDLDGTLINNEGTIFPENAEAIRAFQAQGGRFTISSGRFPSHLDQFTQLFRPNAPVISHNGAVIYDMDKQLYIRECKLDNDVLPLYQHIVDTTDFIGLYAICIEEDRFEFTRGDEKHFLTCAKRYQHLKMVMVADDAHIPEILQLRNRLRDDAQWTMYNFTRSWANALEVVAREGTKGEAAIYLKEYLGDVEKLVCVGDYDNDETMIRAADVGFAMGNATDELKAIADQTTLPYTQPAIAAVIEAL